MAKLKNASYFGVLDMRFSIHPLFFLFGVYFAFTGKLFVFISYTLVAVLHELGHAYAAGSLGYKLNRITLMPYGAVVSGDIKGLRFSDEVKVALFGPLVNLGCAVLFVALWWIKPELYAYTDLAVSASLSVALVNLIPCAPLDGGRVLRATLSTFLSEKKVSAVLTVSGIAFSCVLGVLFIVSCFYAVNFSLLFFSLFTLFGTVGVSKENRYVKLFDREYLDVLRRGGTVKRIAVCKNVNVKRVLALLDSRTVNEIAIYDFNGKIEKVISPVELSVFFDTENLYKTVEEIL